MKRLLLVLLTAASLVAVTPCAAAAPSRPVPARASSLTGPWLFMSAFPPVTIFGNANLVQAGSLIVGTEFIHGRKVTGVLFGKTILLVFTDPVDGTYYFLGTVSGPTMSGLAVHNGVQSPWQAVRGSVAGAL